jgi:hypothetical protein
MEMLEEIGPSESKFIAAQRMFFIGTAPLSGEGHVRNTTPNAPKKNI